MGAPKRLPPDRPARERFDEQARGWVADFVIAVANENEEAARLLLAQFRPCPTGIPAEAQAAFRLFADIAGKASPRILAAATGRPVAAAERRPKSATRRRAA
jgi:hypothetical protein